MHDILLIIQYICIACVFLESWIILRKWKTPVHSYLFASCVALLVNCIGYLQEMTAKTQDSFVTGVKLSYGGRVWIVTFFVFFILELIRIKIPFFVRAIIVLTNVAIYIVILTMPSNNLYYSNIRFATGGIFPKLSHGNGIVHTIFITLQFIYIVIGISALIYRITKENRREMRRRLLAVLKASIIQSGFFVAQMIGIGTLTDVYDITMIGYFLGTITMLMAILRLDLLGMTELAREYVVDRLSEGILATDNNGTVQYYNIPMEQLFPEIKTHPEKVLAEITRAAEFDENIVRNNQIYIPEKNILKDKGDDVGTIYSLVDETEHFKYMSDLEEQKAIADRANQAKSSFLANMSHEIRTPINAVLGMDEMILRESKEPQTKEYAGNIMSAGKTLLSLINDILDLSKIEEGKMELIPVQYELSSLINNLVNMVRGRAEEKGLNFEINVDETTPYLLYGDEIRLRQCALNLLTNAVKYTESGTVSLRFSYEKRDDDHILLTIAVSDTGIGIREEDMEKLFESFTRIEEERNRTIEGTGLGMNITLRLLEIMGSKLDVSSVYGDGSSFSFTVEQKVCKWAEIGDYAALFDAREQTVYHELFHAPEARILVVDDTEVNLSVIENLLKRTELKIDTATSGQAALILADENKYDAIFIDHMMPEMDGIETMEHLRESGKNAETPTVALTANAVSGAREMFLQAGFTSYLSKPVDGERLEIMLQHLLPDDKLIEPVFDEDENADVTDTDTPAPTEDTPTDPLPPELYDIPEIDLRMGVKNGGSPEGFLSILTVFYRTAAAKADELEQLYRDDDIEGYTIKVHALKSSARIIGASRISELARSLEDAGNNNDHAYLEAHAEELLTLYRSLAEKLAFLQPEETAQSDLGVAERKEAYQTIIEIASSMDFDLMDELMKDLSQYQLPEADQKRMETIRALCLEMKWEDIQKQAEEALQSL
ncbi:MAG: response regulator [Eubacterium sp.]|nr:response regulator [Eubacterium sp.]